MIASPAWKSRNLWQRSRRKIPKHFNNSDVEACVKKREKLICGLTNIFVENNGGILNKIRDRTLFEGSCDVVRVCG
jgi:hypothetical protein